MTIFLIKLSLCWGFFALLYSLLLRHETFFRASRLYLLATMLLSIVLSALPGEQIPAIVYESGEPMLTLPTFTVGLQQAATATNHWQNIDFLWMIYWIGVLVTATRMLLGLVQLARMIKRGHRALLPDGTRIIHSAAVQTPFSFFRWIFIPKSSSTQPLSFSADSMLAHEREHVLGWHSADVLLGELLCIIFWFHPLAYWYKRALRAVHEYLADAAASRLSDIKQYGLLLIGQSQSGMPIAFANHFYQSPLKQRLVMLTKKTSSPIRALKFGLAFPLAMLFAMVFRQAPAIAQAGNDLVKTVRVQGILLTEIPPEFPGGPAAMKTFLAAQLKSPLATLVSDQTMEVVVQFMVEADGQLSDIVAKPAGGDVGIETYLLDAEQAVRAMPKWIPAKDLEKEKSVRATTSISILFFRPAPPPPPPAPKAASVLPEFPGGMNAMFQYLMDNVKYPETAKQANAEGTVILSFVVLEDGGLTEITSLKTQQNNHPDLVAEAIRVVSMMPKWKPGVQEGKVVKMAYTLPIKFKLDEEPSKELFEVDTPPAFPGGEAEMMRFMGHNIQYPAEARNAKASGMVAIQFVVEKDGALSSFKTIASPRPDFGAEAIRVLQLMPKFTPAMKDGQPVRVRYTLPVRFELE